jgi:hypothetical protein
VCVSHAFVAENFDVVVVVAVVVVIVVVVDH